MEINTPKSDPQASDREMESVLAAVRWSAGWPIIPAHGHSKQPSDGFIWKQYNWRADKHGHITQRPAPQSEVERGIVSRLLARGGRSVLRALDDETRSIVVIDVDDPGGRTADEVQDLLAAHGVPRTPLWVSTGREGGGYHLHYRRAEGQAHLYSGRVKAVGLAAIGLPGDLKGRGGYVVAAHALHKTGAVYRPSAFDSLDEAYEHLPVLPLDVFQRLRNGFAEKQGKTWLGSKSKSKTKAVRAEGVARSGARLDAENGVVDLRGVQALEEWTYKPWNSPKTPEDRGECPDCHSESALRIMDGGVRCWACKTVFQPGSAADHTSGIAVNRPWSARDLAPQCWPGAVDMLPLDDAGYLRPERRAATEVWAAPMGSGKTTAAAELARQAEDQGLDVIVVSPRISLAERMAGVFAVQYYRSATGTLIGSTSICAMSLHRLDLRGRRYAVVVDEVEQTVQMLLALASGSEADARARLMRLAALVADAEQALLLDAHAGALTTRLLHLAGKTDALWRVAPPRAPRPLIHAGHPNVHIRQICEDADTAAARGLRIAVACGSRKQARTVTRLLRGRGHTVLQVVSDERDDLTPEALDACTALVYSPALSTGVSLDQRDYWLCTHLLAAQKTGDGHQAMQMISRVRYPVRAEVHVSGPHTQRPSLRDTDPQTYRDLALRRVAAQVQAIQTLGGAPALHDMSVSQDARTYLDFWATMQAETKRHGYGWTLRWMLGDVIDHTQMGEDEEIADECREIRAELREEHADAVGAVTSAELDSVEAATERQNLPLPVREALGLRTKYGQAAETQEQRRELALHQAPERRWAQVQRFARVWAVAEHGARAVAAIRALDEKEQRLATMASVTPHAEQVGLLLEGLRRLGVDVTGADTSPVEITFEAAESFSAWLAMTALQQRVARLGFRLGAAPRRNVGIWLQHLGMSTVRMRDNGGWAYFVSQERLARMRTLAARARADLLLTPAPAAARASA